MHKTSYCDTIKNCRHQDPGHMCPMFRVMCEEALTYTINLPTLMLTWPREVSHSMKPREGILTLFWSKIILKIFKRSGCGAVGRVVASRIRDPRFKSYQLQFLKEYLTFLTAKKKKRQKIKRSNSLKNSF